MTKKISGLPAATRLDGTEQIELNQSGTSVRTATLDILSADVPAPLAVFDFSDASTVDTANSLIVAQPGLDPSMGTNGAALTPPNDHVADNHWNVLYSFGTGGTPVDWSTQYGTRTIGTKKVLDVADGAELLFSGDAVSDITAPTIFLLFDLDDASTTKKGLFGESDGDFFQVLTYTDSNNIIRWGVAFSPNGSEAGLLQTGALVTPGVQVVAYPVHADVRGLFVNGTLYPWTFPAYDPDLGIGLDAGAWFSRVDNSSGTTTYTAFDFFGGNNGGYATLAADDFLLAGGYGELRIYPELNDVQVATVSAQMLAAWPA